MNARTKSIFWNFGLNVFRVPQPFTTLVLNFPPFTVHILFSAAFLLLQWPRHRIANCPAEPRANNCELSTMCFFQSHWHNTIDFGEICRNLSISYSSSVLLGLQMFPSSPQTRTWVKYWARKRRVKKLYQHRPQIAEKGISHFRSLLNRFKTYKFQLL